MANVEWDPETYLELMIVEIPTYFDLQKEVAAATADLVVRDVLELGVGTGETARHVRALHPNARWIGIDSSEAMLAHARNTLPNLDLRRSRLEDPLPAGPFDLVISSLAIHHLDATGKRDLFVRIREVLRPGGHLVFGDVVVPESPEDAQIEIDWVVDLPDKLEDQLESLRESGFEAETRWSHMDLAVVRAIRSR